MRVGLTDFELDSIHIEAEFVKGLEVKLVEGTSLGAFGPRFRATDHWRRGGSWYLRDDADQHDSKMYLFRNFWTHECRAPVSPWCGSVGAFAGGSPVPLSAD